MIHSHGYQSDRHIPMFDWPTEGGHCRKENPAILECLYGLQVQRYERGQQKFTAKVLQLKENITYALQTAQIWVNGGLAAYMTWSCIAGIVMATLRTACFHNLTNAHHSSLHNIVFVVAVHAPRHHSLVLCILYYTSKWSKWAM